MKKQILLRGLRAFPIGVGIGHAITIVASLHWGQGYYVPCAPALTEMIGSQSWAAAFQAVLCGLLGSSFGASSVIWEIDRFSIAKQSGLYFLINALVMMPIAYVSRWMEHSLSGFLQYFGGFAAIFAIIWFFEYWLWRQKVRRMNARLAERE